MNNNSDPAFGDDLMTMTPPHEMDAAELLFPDLINEDRGNTPTSSPEILTSMELTAMKAHDSDDDLESYLTEVPPNKPFKVTNGHKAPPTIQKSGMVQFPKNVRYVKAQVVRQVHPTKVVVPAAKQVPKGVVVDVRRGSKSGELTYCDPPSPISSLTDSETSYTDKGKCMTKSAIAARENRQKKKEHVDILEQKVGSLASENKTLKSNVDVLSKTVNSLRTEVQYLKNVLANQSTLATLLQNIPGVPGVRLTSSEFGDADDDDSDAESNQKENCKTVSMRSNKRKAHTQDHDYVSRKKAKATDGGVCLHVSNGDVSLEFCAECSNKSSKGKP